jgi:hypothetical protein
MRRRVIATVIAGLTGTAVITSCTSGSSSSGAGGESGLVAGPAIGAAAAAPNAPAPATKSSAPADPLVVRTGDLTVRVGDVPEQARRARAIAVAARGVVADEDESGERNDARIDLVLKVPTAASDLVLDRLSELGTTESRHVSSTDASPTVADIDSRVASMQAAIGRLRRLYGQAGTTTEVLGVETQLSKREADLEALQAQQHSLADQTARAAITLHLRQNATPPPPARAANGFVSGLTRGWSAFIATMTWTLGALATLLPFLVLSGLLVTGGVVLRRARRRGTGPPPETAADTSS